MAYDTPARLVVLLHGVGATPQAWQDVVSDLPGEWLMTAPWLSGLKPSDTEPFELARAASDVASIPMQYGAEKMTLVGHSLGAMVAMKVAAEAPELVDDLVLLAPQVNPPKWVVRMQRSVFRLLSEKRLARKGIDKHKMLQTFDQILQEDVSIPLNQIAARTLILIGSQDRPNSEAARIIKGRISGARLKTIIGGHDLVTQSPEDVAKAITEFLRSKQ